MTLRRQSIILALAILTSIASALVSTRVWADDAEDCVTLSGDVGIAACTRVIESGRWQGADLVWAYNNRGNAKRGKGDLDGALADYTRALELNPQDAKAYNNRGNAKQDKGDLDGALADYTRALELNPKHASAYYNRGVARFVKGEMAAAAADFARAQELKANAYAVLWLYLARTRSGADGNNELTVNAASLDTAQWPAPVLALYLGKGTPQSLLTAATHPDPKIQSEQRCEAHFYLAEWHLLKNKKTEAVPLLRVAADQCPKGSLERAGAVYELKRLGRR